MDWVQQTPGLSRSGQAEPRRRRGCRPGKQGEDTGPVLQWTGRTTEEGGDAGQESRERTEGRSQLPRIRWGPHTLPAALTPKDTCSGD